jgi:casein kinase II subunit alpha
MSAAGQSRRRKRDRIKSVSKVYKDANELKPREYWDYEAMNLEWGYVTC